MQMEARGEAGCVEGARNSRQKGPELRTMLLCGKTTKLSSTFSRVNQLILPVQMLAAVILCYELKQPKVVSVSYKGPYRQCIRRLEASLCQE